MVPGENSSICLEVVKLLFKLDKKFRIMRGRKNGSETSKNRSSSLEAKQMELRGNQMVSPTPHFNPYSK